MNQIILDCDLMRFRNSGLYHYCMNLGNYVHKALEGQRARIKYYVPPAEANTFEKKENTIVEKRYHKFWKPFMHGCRVWHAPFQSGRIVPDRRKYRDMRIVLTIHDLNALHEGKPLDEQKKSIDHTQDLIDQSDVIVCISEFTKSDVLKNCDVYSKPLYVIHNGTHKVHEPELLKSSYKPARPFLFGMGYVNRKKNYHVLLPLVKKGDLELVVAGRLDEPDYVSWIRKEAQRMGIEDRVHLTGPVSEAEKAWYLSNCSAFVHPSLAEGFGAPVVEAMRFGKPVFLSDKTSLPEIGGDVAFYFRGFDGDYMCNVLEEGMQEYRKNGLAKRLIYRAEQFNWEQSAAKYLQVYQSLL
jgi:glycosyltransferase involved in cell wall biosynthesis